MATRSAFFDSVGGDRVYGSEDFAELLRAVFRNGRIYGFETNLAVTASSPTAMTVDVNEGAAFVQGRFFSVYDDPEVLAISAAHASNPRIDLVILRLDYTARTLELAIKTGSAAANPVAPTLTQTGSLWEESIAEVRVNAAVSSITAENVTPPTPLLPAHRLTGARVILMDIESVLSGGGNNTELDQGSRVRANGGNLAYSAGASGLWYLANDNNADRYINVVSASNFFFREANPRMVSRARWVAGAVGVNAVRGFGFHSAGTDPGASFDTATADSAMLYSKANGSLIFKTSNNANVQTTTVEAADTTNLHLWEISTRNLGSSWELRKNGVIVARHTTYVPRAATGMYGGVFVRNPSATYDAATSPIIDYLFADGDRI